MCYSVIIIDILVISKYIGKHCNYSQFFPIAMHWFGLSVGQLYVGVRAIQNNDEPNMVRVFTGLVGT